jgi:hypothetical protein
MIALLPDDLIARIAARAGDLETRTDAPPSTRGRTVTVGNLSVAGLDLDSLLRGEPAAPAGAVSLPAVANAAAIADAERALGFALPTPLRQLYANVADGGFGPGGGIMPLKQIVSTYRHPGRVNRNGPRSCCRSRETIPAMIASA